MDKLLIDSGGTKAQWAYLHKGARQAEGTVPGIHPFFLTEDELVEKLLEIKKSLPAPTLPQIFHYGTGTNSGANRERLHRAYQTVFPGASIAIDSDLLAVARALCGRKPGIAAILGTGSNVGLYDGEKLVKTVGGLGYVLGDEGSGAHLGKTLLNYYINRLLPTDLSDLLEKQYILSRESILEAVYRQPFPNRYLAGVAPFLAEHLAHAFVVELIKSCFRDFFRLNILPLQTDSSVPLYCGGSIAFHFSEALRDVAGEFDISVGKVAMSPMEGLIAYHGEDY